MCIRVWGYLDCFVMREKTPMQILALKILRIIYESFEAQIPRLLRITQLHTALSDSYKKNMCTSGW